MSILESEDEGRYLAWATSRGIICEKVKFVTAGYPDRLSVLPDGLHVWIEFKRKGKEPEPIQDYRMRTLRDANALAGWTDDSTVAIFAVRTLLEPTRIPKAGHQAAFIAVCGRSILGSWFGQDLNLLSVVEDFKRKGFDFANPNRRPIKTDV